MKGIKIVGYRSFENINYICSFILLQNGFSSMAAMKTK
jgi:hypothetical protein